MGMTVQMFGSLEEAELWKENNAKYFTWVRIKEIRPDFYRAIVPNAECKKWAFQHRVQRTAEERRR